MKLLRNAFFSALLLILTLSLTASFVLILFLINKGVLFNKNDINLLDMLFKSSFALIGSTVSGIVAIFIYYLGDKRHKGDKTKSQTQYLLMIENEYKDNLDTFKKVYEIFRDSPVEQIAALIVLPENRSLKEKLRIYYNRLDFSIIEDSKNKISENDFINNIGKWRKMSFLSRNLFLLVNDLEDQESILTVLRILKNGINELTSSSNS